MIYKGQKQTIAHEKSDNDKGPKVTPKKASTTIGLGKLPKTSPRKGKKWILSDSGALKA